MNGARPHVDALERMAGALHHRGPDGYGYYVDGPIGLGHARLSIIDLATGDQPIHNEDRSVWVTFNGEIFNYIELREQLRAQGHRFYTTSDTEVIVHLYEQHGEQFVEHLNGQFAIALWDARAQRLVLARDRVGIRPLFYARSKHRFLFASEAKALFAEGSIAAALDHRALGETLTYWAPLPGRSAFAGVSSLPPGTVLTLDSGGERLTRYWDWDFGAAEARPTRPADAYAEELRALLTDAVRLQLRADVPVGAYLSGGLDSSAVTALVREIKSVPVRAFSLLFDDPEFDEREYQSSVADHVGVVRSTLVCGPAAIGAAFPRAVWHAEATIVRTAPVPLMLLSALVRQSGYKVVLTGEGADEVFAGYDLFREAKVRRWVARHPDSAWRSRLIERLYPYLQHSPVRGRAFSQQFFAQGHEQLDRPSYSHLPRWATTQRAWQFFNADLRAELAPLDAAADLEATLPPAIGGWSPLARDQYLEAQTLLSGYLLSSQGDRMSMANSVEGRFPYLDHRLIEFACRLPARLKLAGLREKWLLKRAVKDLLPAAVLKRPKQPYRAPDSQSFVADGNVLDYVAELLSPGRIRDAGYFDPEAVGRLTEKCVSGRAIGFGDNMSFVGILSTMLLHELYVRRRPLSAFG